MKSTSFDKEFRGRPPVELGNLWSNFFLVHIENQIFDFFDIGNVLIYDMVPVVYICL